MTRGRVSLFGATRAMVVVGGVLILFLVALFRQRPAPVSVSPAPIPVGTPQPSPATTPTPLPTPTPAEPGRLEALGVSFILPEGYRVAAEINAFDAQQAGSARFTITRASAQQESEYIRLVSDLEARQVPTEAPAFAPGRTITLEVVQSSSAEQSDAALARERAAVTLASGATGTRYRRVEGLQTYDATYVRLPSGASLAIYMTYSTEEPSFDDGAYAAVLDSLAVKP